MTLRVEATGRLPAPVLSRLAAGSGARPVGSGRVQFAAGEATVPMFDRATLAAGERIAGPAIVTQLDATTLLPPDWSIEVHASGTLLLRR